MKEKQIKKGAADEKAFSVRSFYFYATRIMSPEKYRFYSALPRNADRAFAPQKLL
jgi:hypothetical protein